MTAKDDFLKFSEIAEMLGLKDDEHDNFIGSAMERRGHKPKIDWVDAEDGDANEGGDFFSSKRRTRETRETRETAPKRNKGWQYGS